VNANQFFQHRRSLASHADVCASAKLETVQFAIAPSLLSNPRFRASPTSSRRTSIGFQTPRTAATPVASISASDRLFAPAPLVLHVYVAVCAAGEPALACGSFQAASSGADRIHMARPPGNAESGPGNSAGDGTPGVNILSSRKLNLSSLINLRIALLLWG